MRLEQLKTTIELQLKCLLKDRKHLNVTEND